MARCVRSLAFVLLALACASPLAAQESEAPAVPRVQAPPTAGPALVLPPRAGAIFRSVDGGVREWWMAELAAAGVELVPRARADAVLAELISPEKPFLHGSDSPVLAERLGVGSVYATELAYAEGEVEVWMRVYEARSAKVLAVGHAEGKLAKLGELLNTASAPLLARLGAPHDQEVARLGELGLYEHASDALRAGRPADVVPLVAGAQTRVAEGLRAQLDQLAGDPSLSIAERSRLASATGANDPSWLQVRQGLIDGSDPALLLAGATHAEARGDRERALELYQQAAALAPADLRPRVGAARMLSALDRHQDAAAAWEGVIAADPGNLEAHEAIVRNPTLAPRARAERALSLGKLKAQSLDPEGAQQALDQAAQLSPDVLMQARLDVARLNARIGNNEEALLTYEELGALDAKQLGAQEAETFAGLGRARSAAGDAAGASQAYERALAVDPDNPSALQGQGEALLGAGKASEAVAPLARAVELTPADAAARRSLASAHRKAGDPDAALGALDSNAVPLEDRPRILREAAEIQAEKGDLASAKLSLEKAVKIAPDDPPLRSALAKVYAETGDAEAAAREEARLSALTGVALDPKHTAASQKLAAEAAQSNAGQDFASLAASFPVGHEGGRAYDGVVFLGLDRDPTAVDFAREWLLPRSVDHGALEAELAAAFDARYRLAPLAPVSDLARPAYERVQGFSTDPADLSLINDELHAEVSFVAKLTQPESIRLDSPLGGPVQIDVRMQTGRTSDDITIRANAVLLPSTQKFVRWNPRALVPYALLLVLIALPLVRGWGKLSARLDYEGRKNAKGFFSIVISRRPGKATREREQAGSGKTSKYQRRVRSWGRFSRHMVGRETLFRWIPARDYYVCVHGIMQDERGEILGNYLEEKKVRIRRGEKAEVAFDFRPKEASIEVHLIRPEGDPTAVVRVAMRGVPSSLKFVKDEQTVFYVGKGQHAIVVGYGDCVYEREVAVHELASQQISIGLGDPAQAVFQGCKEAIEPFLMGDYALCARALDKAGMAQKANELRAKHHELHGDKAEAARFYKAAGHLTQAAALAAEGEDRAQSAELYEQAGDHHRAAEAFAAAGDSLKAAQAYETAYDFNEAIEAYRRAGEQGKVLELLERTGRHHEAGGTALALGDEERAIRNFQQVDLRDPDYGESCRALADLFTKREEWALAVDRMREAIHSAGEEAAPLELFEQLGELLEKSGEPAEALQVFEGIRKRDYQYPNVAERIRALREQAQALETLRASQLNTAPGAATARASDAASAPSGAPAEDRYEILGELGRGGMGIVYKARDRRLGRVVALKRLPDNLRDHPTAVALFLREAQSAAALNHANIVTIYDADQSGGHYYLTMEYLEGFPLDAILRKRGKLSAKDALRLAVQISTGLQFAHERGLVHRDIKTANLFFTRDRVVKIMDFGLAKMVEEVRRAATVIGGTPYYMAPEQAAGENVDHRADLYAFGVTLFELLAGRVPFKDGDVTYHHRHTPPPDLRELVPETPAELADLVMQLLAKSPEERPGTTAEVTAALDELLRRGD